MYRTEHAQFAWKPEEVEGTAPATIDNTMGIIKGGIVLPDPDFAWDPFFGVGRGSRDRLDIHEGPQTFHASIPTIMVQFDNSREILAQVLGHLSRDEVVVHTSAANASITYSETGVTDTAATFLQGTDVTDGVHAIFAGASVGFIPSGDSSETVLTVFTTPARANPGGSDPDTEGWNGPTPVSGANGDGYEIRLTESVGTSSGDKFIVEKQQLSTMSWAIVHRGSRGESDLRVNYLGGKVNRATLSARQGQKLLLALDDVTFRDLRHNVALPSSSVAKYSGSTSLPTPSHPQELPLVFSQGVISMFELSNTFARIVSFNLVIDNQLTEQQYLSTVVINGTTSIAQIPHELTEGTRNITLEVEAFLDNRQYWEHLMREGQNDALSAKTGFDIMLTFQNSDASESMWIQSPAPASATLVNGVDGSSVLASATNVGVVIETAPHSVPPETEALIPIRFRMNLPSLVFRYTDA